MDNDSNKIKLNLKGVIVIILVFAILAAIGIAYLLIKQKNSDIAKPDDNKNIVATNEVTNTVVPETPVTPFEGDISDFDINFLKMENNKKNNVYSPLSIKYALAMLIDGANGTTKEQIEKVIGDKEIGKYTNVENVLSLANAVFIKDEYKDRIKEEYTNTLKEKYNAEVNYDSFANANNMNSWIEKITFSQLKNIIDDGVVQDPLCRMILINALAIDMEWKDKFDDSDTYGEDFTLEDGSVIKATTMKKTSNYSSEAYYQDENVTAVSMDLKETDDSDLEFIAIMPNKENLSTYINNVTEKDIDNIKKNLITADKTSAGVHISIPKFSFDYELSLENDLKAMGITDAFLEGVADFSNMSTEKLHVGTAIHKAKIDFTEKGVKAAAVTVFGMVAEMAPLEDTERPIDINIDKPFMYLIVDKKSNETWFVGSLFEPNKWEDDQAEYKEQY